MSVRRERNGPRGSVRIVAGSERGRRLKVPPGEVRPTGERVREAVFNALGPVTGLYVLDLFAGTGALGLESLSRGAAACVFVDSDPRVAEVLRANVATLGMQARSKVIVGEYEPVADRLASSGRPFDLLFLDPPYRILAEVEAKLEPLLSLLVGEDGVVVVEGPRGTDAHFGREPVFDRVYGDTRVTMVTMRRNEP